MRIRTVLNIGLLLSTIGAGQVGAAEDGAAETVKRLPASKHSLVDAIRQAEKTSGTPILVEFEDGKLWLSVYTAKDGKMPDAEHNILKGPPYSAIPRMLAGRPVLEVLVPAPDGKSATVDVDLQTNKATKH